MLSPNPKDAVHKAWLYRLLMAIADDVFLVQNLRFKGGTCAAMRDLIDRFSVDLDFDLADGSRNLKIRAALESIFRRFDLKIEDQSSMAPQYFLKYPSKMGGRNSIKIDVTFPSPKANDYEAVRLQDIDRIIYCQTPPTMFANKMVAIMDRYGKSGGLAGRDLFDLHSFFLKGLQFKTKIITERTGKPLGSFLKELRNFIDKHFTQTIIDQDLNTLLTPDKFKKIRKILKLEVLMFFQIQG